MPHASLLGSELYLDRRDGVTLLDLAPDFQQSVYKLRSLPPKYVE